MPRVPAPVLRAFTVAAIGAALVVGHVTFAAAGASAARPSAERAAQAALSAVAQKDRRLTAAMAYADNCYVETQVELTADGKTVSRLVQECD